MILSRSFNRILWLAVLALLVVLGIQARDHFETVFIGVGRLDVRDAPEDDSVYLSWRGKIDAPMASRIADAFAAHKGQRNRFVLSLASPGGSLSHGALVIRELRKIAATHQLETIVEGRSRCASMCVPIYLQGEQRSASSGALFMFHEVSFREVLSEDAIAVPASATASATDRFFETYFKPAGVPDAWIAGIRSAMSGGRDVWKTGQALLDENARIVQHVH